jgi:hypothetical protein
MHSPVGNSPINSLPRDQYGALSLRLVLSSELQTQASAFVNDAVKAGHLPRPFIAGGAKEYECLNLDVYDVLISRGKVKAVVMQARSFWKNLRKGYTRSGKDYYLVIRSGRKFTAKEVEKSTCAKRAKNTTALGQLVKHYLGKTSVACKKAKVLVWPAYKVLAKTTDGRLVSAYDDSEYKMGAWRSEAAKPDHGGGFYYYLDDTLAIDATKRGTTFSASVTAGKKLILCEVEIRGREIEYGDCKWAASQLRVISELPSIAPD